MFVVDGLRDAAEMDKADTELKKLAQPVGGSAFEGFSGYDIDVARQGDDAVTLTLTDVGMTHRLGSAIQASIETIRRRVDAFGTTEPSIQREGRNRILVQVPGIQDVERLKTARPASSNSSWSTPLPTQCKLPRASRFLPAMSWSMGSVRPRARPRARRRYPTCSRARSW